MMHHRRLRHRDDNTRGGSHKWTRPWNLARPSRPNPLQIPRPSLDIFVDIAATVDYRRLRHVWISIKGPLWLAPPRKQWSRHWALCGIAVQGHHVRDSALLRLLPINGVAEFENGLWNTKCGSSPDFILFFPTSFPTVPLCSSAVLSCLHFSPSPDPCYSGS